MLNLFYEEQDNDRWFLYDRYPRKIIRRLVRGIPRPGGHRRTFLNLRSGLDRLGVRYRVNNYAHVRRHPFEMACIVGQPFVLDKVKWVNPIIFGPAIYSHPVDDPNLLQRLPVKKILACGQWMADMCAPYWGKAAVEVWPVGIDTGTWSPVSRCHQDIDVLLYDKIRWQHDSYETLLVEPIRAILVNRGLSIYQIRYGHYREEEFRAALARCRAMIFLCEHETQGIAYQQALSCGVPLFAWDRQGPWRDPSYYPDKVIFEPVTSVPYWDDRCGLRFADVIEFAARWDEFWEGARSGRYAPRDYIVENLTLEQCARRYLEIVNAVSATTN